MEKKIKSAYNKIRVFPLNTCFVFICVGSVRLAAISSGSDPMSDVVASSESIFHLLSTLNVNKAYGPNPIHNKVLSNVLVSFPICCTCIMAASWRTGVYLRTGKL